MAMTSPNTGTSEGRSYAGQLAKSGPRDRLNGALKALDNAAKTASATADSLCGSTPTQVGEGNPDQSSALFPALLDMASEIERQANSIIDSMERINRSIA